MVDPPQGEPGESARQELGRQLVLVLGEQRQVERLLGVEVPVDDRFRDPGGGRDVLEPGRRVAVAREQRPGRARDLRPTLVGGNPLVLRRGRHGYRRVTWGTMLPAGNDAAQAREE